MVWVKSSQCQVPPHQSFSCAITWKSWEGFSTSQATVDGRKPAPVEVASLSHYLHGFLHPRWCRISPINSINKIHPCCVQLVLHHFWPNMSGWFHSLNAASGDSFQAPLFFQRKTQQQRKHTLPESNIAPKNGWLEYYFPIGEAYFQRLC